MLWLKRIDRLSKRGGPERRIAQIQVVMSAIRRSLDPGIIRRLIACNEMAHFTLRNDSGVTQPDLNRKSADARPSRAGVSHGCGIKREYVIGRVRAGVSRDKTFPPKSGVNTRIGACMFRLQDQGAPRKQ